LILCYWRLLKVKHCRCFTGCPPRGIPEVINLGEETPRSGTWRCKEHKIYTGSGREVRKTLRPVWWFVLPWVLMLCFEGVLAPLIYPGGQLHKS
jgi:hypothetical protein